MMKVSPIGGTMLVWRVENNDGSGPYRDDDALACLLDMGHNETHELPPDWVVTQCVYSKSVRFAFPSFDAYEAWFALPAEREILMYHGFHLCTYEVPDNYVIWISDFQMAIDYWPKTAIKMSSTRIAFYEEDEAA